MHIPLCDLKQQYVALKNEIDAAMQDVAAGGKHILGPNVAAIEREVADYCQCKYGVGVNSGTDALYLALRALDIGPGDEVITTPFTFIATTEAICLAGAKPVFVDIDPHTFNLDAGLIDHAITSRTKAILPVHLYGQPCDMDPIAKLADDHGLAIIEDCAQAIGAIYKGRKVGSFGSAGCLSFFPSKNLGCLGDGGMVVTNDHSVYERVEMLRRHGGKVKYHHTELGLNSRLDELQAAVLRVKLRHLDAWNRLRRERAYRYNKHLESFPDVQRPAEISSRGTITPTAIRESSDLAEPVYHQYTVLVDDRADIHAALARADIGCAVYYPVPLHLQQVYAGLGYRAGELPNAESAANKCLSLPMFPELSDNQQVAVARALVSALDSAAQRLCGA
jgi:dTDP-4-amino-4,6-dideoxygalactose transaminase